MDRITKSFLDEFCKNYDFPDEEESVLFEHFVNYTMLESAIENNFEISDINIGVDGTIGLDGFALILNGQLVTGIDELNDILDEQKKTKAEVVFLQAKTSSSFDAKEISSFAYSVADFVSENPKQAWTDIAKDKIALFNALIKRASDLRENPECFLHYVTLGKLYEDKNIRARIDSAVQDIESENLFSDIKFELHGAKELQIKYKQIGQTIEKTFDFEDRVTLPEISGANEAYLGIVKCKDVVNLMMSDTGTIQHNIFYDNVRDYQGVNSVNREIANTLNSSSKDAFVLLNNGITIVAGKLTTSRNAFTVSNFQIINGCQTSHVIFENKDKLNDSIFVTLKLIITQDKELTSRVIRSTNRQTEVKEQDLIAFTDFQKRLEDFYASFSEPNKLYYERRSKQYARINIEKRKIVDKTQQIKSLASLYFDKPELATRFFGALFKEFKSKLFNDDHNMEPYYIASFGLYKIEQLFHKKVIDKKFYKIRFYILMMLRHEVTNDSCPKFESKAIIKYSNNILIVLQDEVALVKTVNKIIAKLGSMSLDLNNNEVSKSKKLVTDCLAKYNS